jgi:DNA primase
MENFVVASYEAMPDRAREALWARGVTDEQITQFRLGHVSGSLPEGDYPEHFLKWCSIGDRLDDVFVLPLTNALGDVRGIQFRHVDRSRAGYMDFIEVNDEAIFFGLAQAAEHWWASKEAYLVEGGFDLFPIQRVFPGSIATLTARVTDPLLRLLRRLVTRIWLGYDMDGAGRRACERYQKQLCGDFDVMVVTYPQVPMLGTGKLTKDPGDLWETWGDAKFQEFVRTLLGVNKESDNAQGLRHR